MRKFIAKSGPKLSKSGGNDLWTKKPQRKGRGGTQGGRAS
jgi:hypothetical protein